MNLTDFREQLFARGAQAGFTDMEISFQSRKVTSSGIFKGEVDTYTIAEDGGVAFRGLWGGKMGDAYTEKVDESSFGLLLDGARANAQVIDSEQARVLFEGSPSYAEVSLHAEALERVTPAQQIDFLKAMEAECYRLDPRVVNVNYCRMGLEQSERMIANTKGLSLAERSNEVYTFVSAVVQEGAEIKNAFKFELTRDFTRLDPVAMARDAVAEALSFLGGSPVKSGTYPVLLRHTAAASLLQAFVSVFIAENVQKGKSRLKGKVGERIAGENITLIDDPFLPDGAESRTFDSEGVATRRMAVVEGGVLQTLLYNLKTALVDGVESTGHGHKPSYKGAVRTAPSNMYIKPGAHSFDELVASTDEGVIVTSLQGLHSGTNAISGDFSLAAHGYYVKGGRIERPVSQITVAGNFYDLLNSVEAIGSDLKFSFPMGGYLGAPTLKIRGLAVAGT